MKSRRLGPSSDGSCTAHAAGHPLRGQEVFGGMGEKTRAALSHVALSQASDYRVFFWA